MARMRWHELYPQSAQPTMGEIAAWVDSPLFRDFLAWMEARELTATVEYSRCGMDPGWNVKGKKKSRAICALYPRQGFFTCMVVLGPRLVPLAQGLMEECAPETQRLFAQTPLFQGSVWMVLDVTDQASLEDAKRLAQLKIDVK